MYFIYNGVSYQYEGQPSDNYYDFKLNPLISNPCDDILEKSRLLYGLREKILYSDEYSQKYFCIYKNKALYLGKHSTQPSSDEAFRWFFC